jgi:ligand-binding SRPBCC domain-containing protein
MYRLDAAIREGIRPLLPAAGYRLEAEVWLPAPRHEVFEFFGDPGNLQLLTPPWLDFSIKSELKAIESGSTIEYQLKLHRVPVRWVSEITVWDPPRSFVDEQVTGPYKHWVHTHLFEETDGGTSCIDSVEFAVPGGDLVARRLVLPDLKRIFDHRQRQLLTRFHGSRTDAHERPVGKIPTIAIWEEP